jgi:hypothetical protein
MRAFHKNVYFSVPWKGHRSASSVWEAWLLSQYFYRQLLSPRLIIPSAAAGATTVEATPSAAGSSASSPGAFSLRPCLAHIQRPIHNGCSVQGRNCLVRILIVCHFNEAESLWTAGCGISNDLTRLNLSDGSKDIFEFFLRYIVRQITDIQLLSHVIPSSGFLNLKIAIITDKKGSLRSEGLRGSLLFYNIDRLESFGAFLNIEANRITFRQGPEAVSLYGREVDENIISLIGSDKAETLCIVKPFY